MSQEHKKFRFTIGAKLYLGFGVLIVSTLIAFILTLSTLKTSREINDKIEKVITPSVDRLEELNLTVVRSKMWINNWVKAKSVNDNPDAQRLKRLIDVEYPAIKSKILDVSQNWEDEKDKDKVKRIFGQIDTLFAYDKDIMGQLNTMEAYNDPMVKLLIDPMIEESGEVGALASKIFGSLDALIENQREVSKNYSHKMLLAFNLLQFVVQALGFALTIGGILIAFFTIRSIVSPIGNLKRLLLTLGKGIVPKEKIKKSSDEIGEMSTALESLIKGFERTTVFAEQVGSGNFESEYQPLSDQDTLGATLLTMREDLKESKRDLEQKVEERTQEVVKQKNEIEHLLEEVTDSIKYAKRIQDAILPPSYFVEQVLPKSFILFKPKDIVSGDFYWVEKKGNKVLFASVDCTGHGVPGAFMSIVGHNILKQAVNKLDMPTPSLILDELSKGVNETLHQKGTSTSKDGMDITICAIDYDKNELEFAGAFNPLYLLRNNEIHEVKGDKLPIGMFVSDEHKKFTNHKIQLQPNDIIYIFSDGYCDQFGGPKGKKFMASRFRDLLLNIQNKSMTDQKIELLNAIESWRGPEEQVDDVLVIGVKI